MRNIKTNCQISCLANDSWTYEDSMFYEGYTTSQQLSKMDKEVIKMLYSDSYAKRD
ncbi:MAG: hypothetical protein ACKO6J_08495 [Crocinitomicaceae bacterium]